MSAQTVRCLVTAAATISTGLAAGAFAIYAHTIMPGLHKTDDRTFVTAFQALDRQIYNPWFMAGTFFGALVLTAVAAALSWRQDAFWWIAGALIAYFVAVVITVAVHVPLNDAIKSAGAPDRIDLAKVRADFHETRWVAWNIARAITALGAFASLSWALVLCGRASR